MLSIKKLIEMLSEAVYIAVLDCSILSLVLPGDFFHAGKLCQVLLEPPFPYSLLAGIIFVLVTS